jgi:NADH dehydrogenase FAD-containing subunit
MTPLLVGTAVGTLEFRAIIEPVRTLPYLQYFQGSCKEIDTQAQTIKCKDTFNPNLNFSLSYDYLVIACGARNNTFNTPGVEQYGYPLKNLWDSRAVRTKLLENFERASSLTATPEERVRLSTIVIVGGGPTSIEFSGELWDFLNEDVRKWYPEIIPKVLIIEVGDHILGTFDTSLSAYAEKLLSKRKHVKILTKTKVVEVTENFVKLNDGNIIPTGLVVWNTGIMQNEFIKSLDFQKGKRYGGITVNEYLQVLDKNSKTIPNVFCLGDCANYADHPLPATAQVASQEGRWLAKLFHKQQLEEFPAADYGAHPPEGTKPFHFHNLGVLAYIGGWRALAQLSSTKISGYKAWILWRSAYLTNLLSWKNRFLVAMYWFKSFVFGRDISRF